MHHLPFTFGIALPQGIPEHYDNHITRALSSMRGQYADPQAYAAMLAQADVLLYEVYEIHRPAVAGELLFGASIVHPGKVGAEYFMTKGHFHAVLETAEIYYCLAGAGMIVMETPEGECSVIELRPGKLLYVPPRWAHRSVNTGVADLVTFFVYPGHAGHDYGSIEKQGFRKLVVEHHGRPEIVDNPRWLPPEERQRLFVILSGSAPNLSRRRETAKPALRSLLRPLPSSSRGLSKGQAEGNLRAAKRDSFGFAQGRLFAGVTPQRNTRG